MTAYEILDEARFRAHMECLSRRKRLKMLRRITEILGDENIVPMDLDGARKVGEARSIWNRLLPRLVGS